MCADAWRIGGAPESLFRPRGFPIAWDESDGTWVSVFDTSGGEIRRYDSDGAETLAFATLYAPTDLVFDENGQSVEEDGFVVARTIDGWVDTSTSAGSLVSSFPAFGTNIGGSIALAKDGTTWTSAYNAAELIALGSQNVADDDLHLLAVDLPGDMNAYLMSSADQGFVAKPGGSAGNLCLGGSVGRHVAQLGNSGAVGAFRVQVDLDALPLPDGTTYAIQPGETWNFQCWFRDGATSNFTDGVSILFR